MEVFNRPRRPKDNMWYKNRSTETYGTTPAVSGTPVPQIIHAPRAPADNIVPSSQRYSLASVSSSGRRSSSSYDSSMKNTQGRPSGIPRSTSATSQARLNALASSRPLPRHSIKQTTSSTSSTMATMSRSQIQSAMARSRSLHNQPIGQVNSNVEFNVMVSTAEVDAKSTVDVITSQRQVSQPTSNLPPRLIPELQALAGNVHKPQLMISSTSTISSPSTIFTGSPSPWSTSTATTTPISWSSTSPSIIHSSHSPAVNKRSQTVPILAIGRTRLPKLPAVQESTSGPSSFTQINLRSDAVTPPRKNKKTPVNSPAPTPPPRSSSIQRTRSRSGSKSEEQSPITREELAPPPLPVERSTSDSLQNLRAKGPTISSVARKSPEISNRHDSLQHALNAVISRNEVGCDPLSSSSPQVASNDRSLQSPQTRVLLEPAHILTSTQVNTSARKRLAKFSKMALFGRTAAENEPDNGSKTESRNLLRKGPVAGTGHEGYRTYSKRGKSSSADVSSAGTDSESSVVSTSRNRVPSTSRKNSSTTSRHSRKSQAELDDFASSRLQPVAILGGSQKSSSRVRDSYGQVVSMANESLTHADYVELRPITTPMMPLVPLEVDTVQKDRSLPQNHTEDISTQAQYSSKILESEPFPLLTQITSRDLPAQPYLNNHSWNTSQSSVAPSSITTTDIGSDLSLVGSNLAGKQKKKSRRLRWNFFKRRGYETDEDCVETEPLRQATRPGMAVSVTTVRNQKSIPYYAMIESESEINTAETLGEYLNEAVGGTDIEDDDEAYHALTEDYPIEYGQRHESILLPPAPRYQRHVVPSRVADPQVDLPNRSDTEESVNQENRRQPRLAQVGRIPKVITTNQPKQPTRKSFSRPFKHDSSVSEADVSKIETQKDNSTSARPALEVHTNLLLPRSTYSPENDYVASVPIHPNISFARNAAQSLKVESLRSYDRQSTTSSSSDGMISVIGPPLLPSADATSTSLHRHTAAEDDVWNEYDDFIDHVTSPQNIEKPWKAVTEDEKHSRKEEQEAGRTMDESVSSKAPALAKGLSIDTSLSPAPVIYASSEVPQEFDLSHEIRLRRSRIVSALHSSMDPSSPFSIEDYLAEYGHSVRNSARDSSQLSSSTVDNSRLTTPKGLGFPEIPPVPSPAPYYENSLHIDEVQRGKDPAKHSELSYTSLMVSRWLSFGRVLFSPAHVEVQRQPERHVLVIDGLGSDDWSIYCAVTYQTEQAYIYDLKETGHSRTSPPNIKTGSAPPNLRRREVASFYNRLKFPDNFFSVIVFRFPHVMAESKLRNMMSECSRVLAPGGYMELMLLDLDVVNMGVLTRRALRELKTRISIEDPSVCLKPVLDSFQGALGEKGFTKLRRCVVGVPVVGKPPGNAESPASSRSSGGSDKNQFSPSAGPRPFDGLQSHSNHNFSLNDLVQDHSENADAKISQMVSRTARNWWQHCFEAAVIPDGNLARSIFADKQVLRECKARASSFKLLIAYTQKPYKPTLESKRRTMSEPVLATLATA